MAQSVVNLFVNDNGFNAKLKNAMKMFAQLGGAANSAKGQFSKFADGIAQVSQSQQLLNAALKGNPYGLMAQAATMAFTKIIELSTQASEAEMRAAEDAQRKAEIQQTANEAIGRSTGELMAKYELLRVEWLNLSSDQQKNDWIKQNQSAFKSLNLAVDGVTSAENVFVNNTSQVVAALKARAEAEAYADLYKEQIKKNALNKATGQYNPTKSAKIGDRPSLREAKLAGITSEDYTWETRTVHDRYGRPGTIRESRGLNKTGVAKMNQLYAMGGASAENADRMQADYWASKMAQAQANANALSNNSLFGPVGGGGSGGGGGRGGAGGFDISRIAFNQPSNNKIVKPEDYIAVPSVWEQYGQEIVKSMNTTGDAFEQAIDKLSLDNWSGDAEVLNFLKKFAKYGDDAANSWRAAGSAISTVGSAVSGLDDNAGKIMSIIGEAIANIAAAAGIATKKAAGESVHWTEYVGAAAGIIATMVSAISTVHSSTGYAHGGKVEGNTYSGDQIPIMANAGEVILNQAQQSNVAHALQGGAFGGMHLTARLDGKDLLLSIDRTGQTLGYGQLVFFH